MSEPETRNRNPSLNWLMDRQVKERNQNVIQRTSFEVPRKLVQSAISLSQGKLYYDVVNHKIGQAKKRKSSDSNTEE